MQDSKAQGQNPEVGTDLDNQIRFLEYMLQGYKEPTGQKMLSAIKGSLEKLKLIENKGEPM